MAVTVGRPPRLDGRVALVSGALRGIGRATVECLLEDGAKVIATDLDRDGDFVAAIEALSPDVVYARTNVTSEADWAAARELAEQRFGRLDILVNNAGTALNTPISAMTVDQWRQQMTVNAESVFLSTRALEPLLARSGADHPGGASIVNVASIMANVGIGGSSAYTASKAAVRLFTKSAALEYADAGVPIRVNSVHPGFIETPLLLNSMEEWVEREGSTMTVREMTEATGATLPMKRMGKPIEIARMIAFLASDDASYANGAEFTVDGAYTAR